MHEDLDKAVIEFDKSVLGGIRRAIATYYKRSKKLYMTESQAVDLFKSEIDKLALTELCPQMFDLTTLQYTEAVKFDWNIEHTEALNILRKNNVFQVSRYFNQLESIGIVDKISESFQSGGRNVDNIVKELRTNIEPVRTTAKAYNSMLVNTVGQNARNISQVKDFVNAGFKYTKIIGFRDELTCPICKKMIGRIFKTSEQLKVADDYLSVDYEKLGYKKAIDKIKEVKPWLTVKDAEEIPAVDYENNQDNYKESKKLITNIGSGVVLAPLHANCRCENRALEGL